MASNLILALNSGSSSLKITLFARREDCQDDHGVDLLLTASLSNISAPPAKFTFQTHSGSKEVNRSEEVDSVYDHATAFAHFLDCLENDAGLDKGRIVYICHRVVHGGDYAEPVIIDEESYEKIEHLSDLAPL